MESWDSDLSNDMYFVKIIKSCDSIRLQYIWNMTPPTKGEEPAKRF